MRILVIEDERRIADAIKKGLEQESFAVDVSYNGLDGYDLASSESYDCLVLDLMLPGMNGMNICRELRKREIAYPILMLTAKGETEDIVSGLNSGADDYLPKPFDFDELLARIRALTRRPKTKLGEILKADDLVLDTTNYETKRGDTKIKLSKKEFALLEYLMRNAGKTQTKDSIVSNVWNFDSDILPNTVEVYIGYLRNKIDKPFPKSKNLIHTVRGFGYKIVS